MYKNIEKELLLYTADLEKKNEKLVKRCGHAE